MNYFHLLEDDILQYKAKGDIILIGDCNSRTGNIQDWVELGDEVDCILSSFNSIDRTTRTNVDTIVNNYGRELISLCRTTGLQIRNGRHGIHSNRFTCFRHNGQS